MRSDGAERLGDDLSRLGLDAQRLLLAYGISDGARPSAMAVTRMYAAAVRELEDPALGLRLGASRGVSWLGPVGVAMAASGSLGAALRVARRYVGLLFAGQRIELRFHRKACHLVVHMPAGIDPVGAEVVRLSTTLVAANAVCELRPGTPVTARFSCPRPQDAELVVRLARAGRRLEYDHAECCVIVPRASLEQPLPGGAEGGAAPIIHALEKARKHVEVDAPIVCRLRVILASRLSANASLALAAHDLGMAPRTLQVQLGAIGTSFASQLRELRVEVAYAELSDGQDSVTNIARRLGFRSVSAFSRFFRRATGQSPRAFREPVAP